MILLFLAALLFLFLTTSIGFFVNRYLFTGTKVSAGLFADLLAGTAAITIYVNILSIFFKTDYLLLIPVCLCSFIITFKTNYRASFIQSYKTNTAVLFNKSNAIITCSFLLVLVLFALVPPYNTDSSGYHFLSILWNEKFKAVPGLANLFPQYGYNSSFFVLSAAFSFTDLVGQSIYPINPVLVIAFFLWLLKRSVELSNLNQLLIWLLLIVLLRQFPINLSSPSADALASILVFYVLFELYFKLQSIDKIHWNLLILLSFFALIIKLSTAPLLLIVVLPFFTRSSTRKDIIGYLKLTPLVLLILLPWLIRNIILSGYLIFPFPAADFFSFDWKVPTDVVIAEKLHIAHAPRMISENWNYVNTLSISTWFPTWIRNLWVDNRLNFIIVVCSLLSPLLLVVLGSQKKLRRAFVLLWMIAYIAIWFWLITSPDIRFGYHYMLPCIFFPLLFTTKDIDIKWEKHYLGSAVVATIAFVCFYYDVMAVKKLAPYSNSRMFVYPLKSPEYFKNNDLATFKYVMLNNKVKLYVQDSAHHSINAPLPVCSPYRKGIKMRGNTLADGFKTEH